MENLLGELKQSDLLKWSMNMFYGSIGKTDPEEKHNKAQKEIREKYPEFFNQIVEVRKILKKYDL